MVFVKDIHKTNDSSFVISRVQSQGAKVVGSLETVAKFNCNTYSCSPTESRPPSFERLKLFEF